MGNGCDVHNGNGKKQIRKVYLTEKDEYVPDTHIPMYDILRNEKNKNIYVGEEQCQNIREKTFNGLYEIYKRFGSPSYADLWNYNIEAINDGGLNYFAYIQKIAPVANLIECFEQHVMVQIGYAARKRMTISFGINADYLKRYFQEINNARNEGRTPRIPHKKRPGNKSRELVLFGVETIGHEDCNIQIEKNAIFNRFKHWCLLNGVTEQEGIMMAMEGLFKAYPINGLNEPSYYNEITELDRNIFTSQKETGLMEEVPVSISGLIYQKSKEIIARYNMDPDNMIHGQMTFDDYINNALHMLNSKMPKKYANYDIIFEEKTLDDIEKVAKGRVKRARKKKTDN